MTTTTLIINVIDYDCNYILSNHDYNHEYNVYHTNVNLILPELTVSAAYPFLPWQKLVSAGRADIGFSINSPVDHIFQ